jgi:hypothetical protein
MEMLIGLLLSLLLDSPPPAPHCKNDPCGS